ncbi:hypothetical protein D3C77_724150 [compost metagenome]
MLGGADAFPSCSDLDQHALAADSRLLIETDQALGALDHRLAVEGQARIHFCGDTPRNQLENFLAHRDGEQVAGQPDIALAAAHRGLEMLGVAR